MEDSINNGVNDLRDKPVSPDFNGLFYFSHDKCGVCKVLRPKVEALLKEQFPKLTFSYHNVEKEPAFAASLSVFTVPILLVYFEGQEFYRFSGSVSIGELERQIARPYLLKFS
jgi:thioredoxin-like negative regulator of GroEL